MSGYGPPPSAPAHGSGASGLGLGAILGYAAGGLGVLDFIWGFLDFFSPSQGEGDGTAGYASIAAGVIGLAVVAGLLAAAETYEKKPSTLLPVVFSVAGLLLVFGTLVSVPDGNDASIGLILALITSILQVAVLVYAYLLATGKISAPAPKPQAPQGYGPPQGGQPGYGGPGGYGQPGPPQGGGQPGYGAPQGPPSGPPQGPPSGPPQGPPPGAPQGPPPSQQQGGGFGPPSSYGAPSSYGPPQGGPGGPGSQPGQSAPGQSSPPPPTGNPYSPPQGS